MSAALIKMFNSKGLTYAWPYLLVCGEETVVKFVKDSESVRCHTACIIASY